MGFSGVYNDLLEILRDQYQKASNEVSTKHLFKKSRLNPDQGLAQHLAVFYWRQLIRLHDPLLAIFMANGNKEAVRSFLHNIGQGIREVKDVPTDVVQSLRELAEWVVSGWKPRRLVTRQALSALGWWVPTEFLGEAEWRLRILRDAAKKAGDLADIERVLTELDNLAPKYSALVIDCLQRLIEGKPKDASRYFLATHSLGILEKAAPVANARTRKKIYDIANDFGSIGHFEYRRFA